jgi:hypothetical protein
MSMRRMRIGAAALMLAGAAQAQDPPASGALTNAQAQARQFGIFFGGTASQYDLCVKKGFLAKGDQTAEQIAQSILDKMRATSLGPDQSAYVQEGWDMMKKEISEHESFYTQEKCTWVGKEWVKMMATMRKK